MTTTQAQKKVASSKVPPEDSPFKDKPPNFAAAEDVMPDMPKSKAETELILKSLLKTYANAGAFVMLFSQKDGLLIVKNSEELTESWRQLLDNDPKLRKTMLKVVKGSGWGAVISAHLTVAIPIINNHKESFEHLIRPKRKTYEGETEDAESVFSH